MNHLCADLSKCNNLILRALLLAQVNVRAWIVTVALVSVVCNNSFMMKINGALVNTQIEPNHLNV